MDTDTLRHQHDNISIAADELADAVRNPGKPRPVATLRWRLARQLLAHLAVEDRFLYPSMITRGGDAGRTAQRFQNEMGNLGEAFASYMSAWNEARIQREWAVFCGETGIILAALAERIDRENDILYPLAGRSAA